MLWIAVAVVILVWLLRREQRLESLRMRRHAHAVWERQQQDAHPWEREEPWPGMEEPHRPRWTRRLRLVARDTWWKEQPRPAFKMRRRS